MLELFLPECRHSRYSVLFVCVYEPCDWGELSRDSIKVPKLAVNVWYSPPVWLLVRESFLENTTTPLLSNTVASRGRRISDVQN